MLENREYQNLSLYNVIGQLEKRVSIRHSFNDFNNTMVFVSQIERKTIEDALKYENWISVMYDELN